MSCKCDKEYWDKSCDIHGNDPKPAQKIDKKVTKIDNI